MDFFVGHVRLEVWFAHVTEGAFPIGLEDGSFETVEFVEEFTHFALGTRHLFVGVDIVGGLLNVKDVEKVVVFELVA